MQRKDAPDAICIWDTETGGIDIENDRILTCYLMVQSIDGSIIDEKSWIIDPGIEVPKAASDVHGMTTEYIRKNGRQDVSNAIFEIVDTLEAFALFNVPIVGYNNSFDLGILDNELKRHSVRHKSLFNGTAPIFFDPIIYDRAMDKYRKGGRKLFQVAEHWGIEIDQSKLHDAEYDVIVTADLAWRMMKKSPYNLTELQQLQYDWKQAWAENLTEYFARIGKTEDDGSPIIVDGSFPWKKPEE